MGLSDLAVSIPDFHAAGKRSAKTNPKLPLNIRV